MLRILRAVVIAAVGLAMAGTAAAQASGAGATLPYWIYAKWIEAYKQKTGQSLTYVAVGSVSGKTQLAAKTTDFAGVEIPLTAEQQTAEGVVMFPVLVTGITPVVNVSGVKKNELKLSSALLADIYLGKIKKWNDTAIQKLNPSLTLPDQNIAVVYRADGSGSTYAFSDYLSKVSPDWKQRVGVGGKLSFPLGMGAKGSDGMAAMVQRMPGSIGYIVSASATGNNLTTVNLQNASGLFVSPTRSAFKAAADTADWTKAPGFYLSLTDASAKEAWPITTPTWVTVPKQPAREASTAAALKFFDWAYANGGESAMTLDYVTLPAATITAIKASWKQVKGSGY